MLRKKWFWIALILALALGGAGYYLYSTRFAAAAESTETESLQTAVASQGDLVILASGTGSIVPAKQIDLGFDESGTLIELNVQEGEQVAAGQVLARLQTSDSAESIASKIAEAELAVVQAQNALDDLYENAEVSRTTALNDIATYSQEVRDAQYTMENYTMPVYLQGLETVEAVEKMKAGLDQALLEFEPYKYLSEYNNEREEKLELLNNAQARYDAAVDRLNNEYVLQVAEANLAKAQSDYQKYKDGPAADELAEKEATLENAKANLALAQAEQSIIDLVAPFDGTVLSTDAIVGGTVGDSAIITLADLAQPTLEVYLDETDLDKVVAGYPVEVTFDALPDQTFTGKVTRVSRSLESVSDVAAIKALVELDTAGMDADLALPVGLNAAVDVIAGQALNAVLVPIEALREIDDNEYAVFVVENGQPLLRVVEVGLMDVTTAEIKSGLQAGEVVSTGITQVK
jgi:RND family efflux transporter MFP subunit